MLSKSINTAIFSRSSTIRLQNNSNSRELRRLREQLHSRNLRNLLQRTLYFLNKLSKALRASEGLVGLGVLGPPCLAPESRVSRSIDVRAMKNWQLFRRSFFVIRSGISWVHSNCAAVSK